MKKTMILTALLLCAGFCQAQKFKEWFRQKKTQKQYLIEQITHLKLYLELTEKGYKIAREGLTTISDIKNREFKLHQNRFDSLRIVSPAVSSHPGLKDITDLHAGINKVCKELPLALSAVDVFSTGQLDHINQVLAAVYKDSQGIIYAMFDVRRSGHSSMNDDERIKRIDLLHAQMQDNYIFVKNFDQQTRLLSSQVQSEKDNIKNSRVLHGLN
jgi:hypothetical protein